MTHLLEESKSKAAIKSSDVIIKSNLDMRSESIAATCLYLYCHIMCDKIIAGGMKTSEPLHTCSVTSDHC